MLTETQELPTGTNEPLTGPSVESFDQAVQETKKTLENETHAQVKRPRGRPRKEHLKLAPEPEAAQPGAEPKPTVEPFPSFDTKPLLRQAFQTPFSIWANNTGCAALALTDQEVETPALYADAMINYYAPRMETMDPGKAAAVMLMVSLIMLVGQKAAALDAHAKTVKQTESVSTAEKPITPSSPAITPIIEEEGQLYNSGRF